jgi:hypothetical protein
MVEYGLRTAAFAAAEVHFLNAIAGGNALNGGRDG